MGLHWHENKIQQSICSLWVIQTYLYITGVLNKKSWSFSKIVLQRMWLQCHGTNSASQAVIKQTEKILTLGFFLLRFPVLRLVKGVETAYIFCCGSREKLILVFLWNREQAQQWLHDITCSVSVLKESGPLNSQSAVGRKGLGRTSRKHWHSFRDVTDKSNSAIKQLLWEQREIHAFILKTGNPSTWMF